MYACIILSFALLLLGTLSSGDSSAMAGRGRTDRAVHPGDACDGMCKLHVAVIFLHDGLFGSMDDVFRRRPKRGL